MARLGASIALTTNIHDHLSTRIVLTWFCIRHVNVRTLVDCSCQCRAFEMLFICILRGRYDLQQSLLVVKKCVHSALDKIVSFEYVYLVGINWDHELFCLLSNFCGDPSGTLVSIDEVLQCHYVYWHAALNTCLLSSELWVACGVSLTQTMDERQCVTGWGTDCIRDAMDW